MVKQLLAAKAQASAADSKLQTPLHLCASCGAEKAALQLIEHQAADIDAADVAGNTPLHLAVQVMDDAPFPHARIPRRTHPPRIHLPLPCVHARAPPPQETYAPAAASLSRPLPARRTPHAARHAVSSASQGGKGCEKVVLLLVQHAATISRNALGLTPRDYALDPETHDTLKVPPPARSATIAPPRLANAPALG